MAIRTLIRTASLATAVILMGSAGLNAAMAADTHGASADPRAQVIQVVSSEANSRFVPLGVGKSVVIDLPRDIKDVLVANPKVANAVIRSARRAYLIGATVGQTNVFFFDAEGRQIAGFDIAVTRDLNGIRATLKQVLPHADLRVEGIGDGVMLSGTAANPAEAQQAYDMAARLVGDGVKVVNSIVTRGRDQVMLKVSVAEVQRDVIKQFGIDLSGSFSFPRAGVVNFNTDNPFSARGQPLSSTSIGAKQGITTDPITGALSPRISATVRAMERAGVIRTLAEPNLTAISGETASFLAGGEFPVVTGTSGPPAFTPQVEFKKFGVSLIFTPVVLSEGRISLKVLTEISELSTEGALSVPGGFSVPSLKTRRAETTVEIPSGGALALAGMIQEQTKQQINGLPGLMQLPILGTLFKSRDYINNQTELMVLVTPYIVRAVSPKDLSRPDDGFADGSDPATVLLGHLNKIYGISGRAEPKQTYRGNYGFILD